MQSLMLLSFGVGVRWFNSKTSLGDTPLYGPRAVHFVEPMKWMAILVTFLCIAIVAFIFVRSGASLRTLVDVSEFSKFYAESRKNGGASFQFLVFTCIFTCLYLAHLYKHYQFYFCALICILSMSVLGGRGFMVCALMCLGLSLYLNYREKFSPVFMLIVGGTGTLLVVAATYFRYGGIDFYIDNVFRKDFDLLKVFLDVEKYKLAHGKQFLVSFSDIQLLIPSSLSLNKPLSTQETLSLYPSVGARGTNITFGLYPNLIFNLGYWGLCIGAIFYVGLGGLYARLCNHKSPISFFVILLFCFQFQWLRGGLLNMRFVPLLICLLLAFCFKKFSEMWVSHETNPRVTN
ncbi:MAG: hypothetical protein AAF203_09350 [Pseudomonadota bacterium]